jgi:hypothetical protein
MPLIVTSSGAAQLLEFVPGIRSSQAGKNSRSSVRIWRSSGSRSASAGRARLRQAAERAGHRGARRARPQPVHDRVALQIPVRQGKRMFSSEAKWRSRCSAKKRTTSAACQAGSCDQRRPSAFVPWRRTAEEEAVVVVLARATSAGWRFTASPRRRKSASEGATPAPIRGSRRR